MESKMVKLCPECNPDEFADIWGFFGLCSKCGKFYDGEPEPDNEEVIE